MSARRSRLDPRDQVREGYDAVSYAYRADDAEDGDYQLWLEELAPHLQPRAHVLDLGCGYGIPAARWLSRRGYTVTGIDLSPVQIERARRLVPAAEFRCADITTLDLPERSFDAIVSFFAIIHVPLAEQSDLLGAMHRWLKPDRSI